MLLSELLQVVKTSNSTEYYYVGQGPYKVPFNQEMLNQQVEKVEVDSCHLNGYFKIYLKK